MPGHDAVAYLGMALTQAEKVRENRLRRLAARRGLHLIKSRVQAPGMRSVDFYYLVDTHTGSLEVGHPDYGGLESLDDVENALNALTEGDHQ
jgi:hypothetical protein